jgi:TraM recognition site of TraD and TraG/Type IV secretion-system coupling protein DNA-binding domain
MKTIPLGHNAIGSPISLMPEDRKTHIHVIGSSGSGKSKFLEWMMRGDLRNRQGFCLLDPHGTLYDDIAAYAAHHVLDREIVLLNLSKPDAVIGFNPFRQAPGADISVQVDRRLSSIFHAWGVANADTTPTLERTLRLVFTVMLEQKLGLPQAAHLIDFNAGEVRGHLIEQLQTPLIQREWRELQSLKAKDWRDETLSAKNRLFRLLTSSALERFMGLPDRSIDLQEAMDQGKIILVNLAPSDQLSHENARVFGALLINEFFECALRREKQPTSEDPKPYYLYLDEFADFVSLDIAAMLDQVRKFGLFMILAHQRFGQLDENLIDAVLTNCKIKAVFGGLPYESAKLMAQELFIGELDPKKIKAAIYQTKFWPKYTRDKVYTHTSGYSEVSGSSSGSTSGFTAGTGTGEVFTPGDWFGGPTQVGLSSLSTSGSSSISSSGSMRADTNSESDSVADIPIFVPVPFQELSSVQYYSLDEQLTEVTAALKEQYGRHCFIKVHQQKTQPMLVPVVENYFTTEANKNWYFSKQFSRQNALAPAEVDQLLESQEHALLKAATSEVGPTRSVTPTKANQLSSSNAKRGRSARASLFSSINIKDD